MMLGIDHVAAAVRDLDAAVDGFTTATGAEHVYTKTSPGPGYRTAYLLAGGDMFTLIEPTDDGSFIASFLDSHGPGFHHIGVNVADLDTTVARMTDAGGEVVHEATVPATRDEATLHPNSWFGLQLQLIEWHESVGPTARDHIEAMRAAGEAGGTGPD